MSRRPQVLRVTDSPNSVLSPRRSPTSPPAVVATLTTCPAVAPPPLDTSVLCMHTEAGTGADTAYRVVTCKDAESTPLQCGSHSLDRKARLGLHRSVPGCLDTVDTSAESGADSRQPLDAALDGLARYLQSNRQGLRELLLSSGLVVVQPLPPSPHRSCRIAGATVKANTAAKASDSAGASPSQQTAPQACGAAVERGKSYTIPRALRFFHPKRHNRELLDEELPDPETVRRARQVFEASLTAPASAAPAPPASAPAASAPARRALSAPGRRWTDCGSVSSGVSSDLSSSYEAEARSFRGSDDSDRASADDDDDDDDEEDAGRGGSPTGEARVSGEVLERIRARGLSVTYYGGRVVASTGAPPPVAAVLSEIGEGTARTEGTGGFRLVKSQSCGSRLQLAGGGHAEELKEGRVFTSTLGDVSLRKDTSASRQLADYCYAGRDLPAARRYPDMEFEEFQVLEEGAGVQGQRGAVCGAA